jgi:hypothetical protein
MLHRVAHVRTDVSEERIASIIRVTRIGELGTLAVTSNRCILQRNIFDDLLFLRNVRRLLVTANVVRFEVFTAVTMKNGVFWDVTPCVSCTNRRFGGT